jgi:hypothetical protein
MRKISTGLEMSIVLPTLFPLKVQELTDLMEDRTLKFKSCRLPLDKLLSIKEEYHVISKMAVRILLPFLTIHLCELRVFDADGNKNCKGAEAKNHLRRNESCIIYNYAMYQSPLLNETGTNITLEQNESFWALW